MKLGKRLTVFFELLRGAQIVIVWEPGGRAIEEKNQKLHACTSLRVTSVTHDLINLILVMVVLSHCLSSGLITNEDLQVGDVYILDIAIDQVSDFHPVQYSIGVVARQVRIGYVAQHFHWA